MDLKSLRQELLFLKANHHVVALKTGTEIEDMSFEEIRLLRELTKISEHEKIPLIVKVGGPEARNDIRNMLKMEVDMVLAPMVESVYALVNFVTTALELMEEERTKVQLAINLETQTALQNLDLMLDSEAIKHLHQVTIGRGDLSKSMHLSVDDEEVLQKTALALRKLKKQGLLTSVGGGLSLQNITILSRRIMSHRLNTRHIVLENSHEFRKKAQEHLYEALSFECRLYRFFAQKFPEKQKFYEKREKVLLERMEYLPVISQKYQARG